MLFHFNTKKVCIFVQKEVRMEPTKPVETGTDLSAESFVPWGSLAFFGLLIGLAILVWLSIYFLMLNRG